MSIRPYLANVKTAFILIIFLFSCIPTWATPIKVLVGAYTFPPYFVEGENNEASSGLAVDLLQLLNQKQKTYHFEIVLTSAARRFQDLQDNRFQIMVFESKSWGWSPSIATATRTFHSGGEVFVALKQQGRNQTYFDNLKMKRLKGFRGYHYGFLGLSTAPKAARDYKLELTSTHAGNIQSVISKRADIAIVPKEYLPSYFRENPEAESKLLISKKLDQVYKLGAIVSAKNSPLTALELTKYIELILKDGSWEQELRKQGLWSEENAQEARPNKSSKLI